MSDLPKLFDLSGRLAVVTGGANGIGRAIALALGESGADVFVTARTDQDALESVREALCGFGVRAGGMLLNCEDAGSVEALLGRVEQDMGTADVLVNNAAVAARTTFLEMSSQEYERTFAVNLRFPYFAIQRFASSLIAQGRTGSVINVSSISAFKAISKMSAYQCSKAGLSMLTKGTAYELAPYGIRVNTLSPGLTATKSNRDQWRDHPEVWAERGKDLPLGRAGQPMDFAGAAVFMASEASLWMTGTDIVVDGGDAVI